MREMMASTLHSPLITESHLFRSHSVVSLIQPNFVSPSPSSRLLKTSLELFRPTPQTERNAAAAQSPSLPSPAVLDARLQNGDFSAPQREHGLSASGALTIDPPSTSTPSSTAALTAASIMASATTMPLTGPAPLQQMFPRIPSPAPSNLSSSSSITDFRGGNTPHSSSSKIIQHTPGNNQDLIIIDVEDVVTPTQPVPRMSGPSSTPLPAAPTPPSENWLVRLVLDLYDYQHYDWMMIADPLRNMWGVEASSATVLGILQGHGRIHRTMWFD